MPVQPTEWHPTVPRRSWTMAKAAAPSSLPPKSVEPSVWWAAGVVEREGLQGGACRVEKPELEVLPIKGQELEPSGPVGWGLPPAALGRQAT